VLAQPKRDVFTQELRSDPAKAAFARPTDWGTAADFYQQTKRIAPDRANWAEVGGLNARDEGGPQVPQR
jgi:hypothetical protein